MDEDFDEVIAAIRARADQYRALLNETAECAGSYMATLLQHGFTRAEALELVRDMTSNLQNDD